MTTIVEYNLETGALSERPMTDAELAAAASFVENPKDQLARLDATHTLTQRNLRETIMLMSEAFKAATGGTVDLSTIPGVAKVYEVEQAAAMLRAQL